MRHDLWSRDEMMLALNLYLKLPFGRLDRKTPEVVHLAKIIGNVAKFGKTNDASWLTLRVIF